MGPILRIKILSPDLVYRHRIHRTLPPKPSMQLHGVVIDRLTIYPKRELIKLNHFPRIVQRCRMHGTLPPYTIMACC